jgi:hypothetical protein
MEDMEVKEATIRKGPNFDGIDTKKVVENPI